MQGKCIWAICFFLKDGQTKQRILDIEGSLKLYEVSSESEILMINNRDNGIDTVDEMESNLVIKYFDASGEGRLMYTE